MRSLLRHYAVYCALLGLCLLLMLVRGEVAALFMLVLLVALGMLGLVAALAWLRLYRRRASNVLLGPEALRVQAGSANGMELTWDLVDSEHWSLEPMPGRGRETVLQLATAGHSALVLARTGSRSELQSFEALLSTLTTWDPDERGTLAPVDQPELVHCERCGAPLPLRGGRAGYCEHCAHAQPLPALVAAKLEAQAKTRQHSQLSEALVQRLLRQPSPRLVNALLFSCWASLFVGIPVVFFVGYGWALSAVLCFSLWLLALLGGLLAERRAVGLLVLDYAALTPASAEAGYRCHSCGGPLADSGTDHPMLVSCRFCLADNLIALDYRSAAHRSHEQTDALAALLRQRRRARALVWSTLALCLGVSVLAVRAYAAGVEDDPIRQLMRPLLFDRSAERERLIAGEGLSEACQGCRPSTTDVVAQVEPVFRRYDFLREPALVPGTRRLLFSADYDASDAGNRQVYELDLHRPERAYLLTRHASDVEQPLPLDATTFAFLTEGRRRLSLFHTDRDEPVEPLLWVKRGVDDYSVQPKQQVFALHTSGLSRGPLVTLHGRDGRRLGEMPGAHPAFSPDGASLVLVRRHHELPLWQLMRGPARVWTDTEGEVVWTSNRPLGPLSWSPDGRWVLYREADSGDGALHVRSLATARRYSLLQPGEHVASTFWGDDGWLYLALSPSRQGCIGIHLWRLRLRDALAE